MKPTKFLCIGVAAFLACALSAQAHAAVAGVSASSSKTESGPASAKNQSPLMKFKILNQSTQETTYAIVFGAGDEVFSGLTQFAEENRISAARITGIGAIRNGTFAWLNPETKKFRVIHVDQQAEVLSLLGDIAQYQGKPVVHVHMVVGFGDGTTRGGHLIQAHVWPTLEVIVTAYPRPLYKKFDPEKGITVIDPSIQK